MPSINTSPNVTLKNASMKSCHIKTRVPQIHPIMRKFTHNHEYVVAGH